jgi:hypothetical protein
LTTLAKLVNDGKRILGEDQVFWCLYGLYGGFFRILEQGNYGKEIELLGILEKWARNGTDYLIDRGNITVDASVFNTHQQYIRGGTRRREFGDVTFATIFSHRNQKMRFGFANTFQIKVEFSAIDAYRRLFTSSNQKQLDFYRTSLIEALSPMYDHLICDFLHYFLIGGPNTSHSIMEVPLSFTWLDDSSGAYWGILPSLLASRYITNRYSSAGVDTMIRKLFLTTGININHILPLCTPNLRDTLQRILKSGVRQSKKDGKSPLNDNSNDKYRNKESEEFVPPDFPISSSIVVATEVSFLE